jgi:hypothetical protein
MVIPKHGEKLAVPDYRFPKERIGVGGHTIGFLAVRGQVIDIAIPGTPAPDLIDHS